MERLIECLTTPTRSLVCSPHSNHINELQTISSTLPVYVHIAHIRVLCAHALLPFRFVFIWLLLLLVFYFAIEKYHNDDFNW